MSADSRHEIESLLRAAERPEAVSYGLRVRVLQAASRANVYTQRKKQFLALAVTATLLTAGLVGGTAALVQGAAPPGFLARWQSAGAMGALAETPASGEPTPNEWRLVDSLSDLRESRTRALRAGM